MANSIPEDQNILDEIIKQAGSLTLEQQKSVLDYIKSIREPRTYTRIRKSIEIDILIDDKIIRSDTRDVSAAGVFVKTGVKAEIGKPAKVIFSLPGQKRPFKLDGRVVRTGGGGMALWFSEMTYYTRELLDNLIKDLDYPKYKGKTEDDR